MTNTKQNNPKSFAKNKFSKENHPKSDPGCALGVHSASNQHNERRYEFYWGYKSHVLVDCISGLSLYELTTPANIMDSTVAVDILAAANQILPLQGCSFLADKGYDAKIIYNTVKSVYDGDAFIPLNPQRIYALRTECERYDSRFKASGQERLWVRNGNSAANLNTLAHISALAVALAAVLHGSHSYRSVKQLRRSA